MFNQLDNGNEEERTAVCLAALLHDVGHGPFSHLFEQALERIGYPTDERDHEKWTQRIIMEDETLQSVFQAHNYSGKERVRSIIGKTYKRRDLNAIVSSQFDADRFDYMLRDSHMTGVHYGKIDINWLLRNLLVRRIEPKNRDVELAFEPQRIVINLRRGASCLQDYLLGNLHLYQNVYFHKTVSAADAMVLSMLVRAFDLIRGGSDTGVKHFALERIARREGNTGLSVQEYLSLDDTVLQSWISVWARESRDKVLRQLANDFLNRKLFKTFVVPKEKRKTAKYQHAKAKIESQIGELAKYYLVEGEPERLAYHPLKPEQIYYVDNEDDSSPKELADIGKHRPDDPISKELVSWLKFEELRLAFPIDYESVVKKAFEEVN
jgi:HD superfamily phosphohydrolase